MLPALASKGTLVEVVVSTSRVEGHQVSWQWGACRHHAAEKGQAAGVADTQAKRRVPSFITYRLIGFCACREHGHYVG